MYCKSFFLRTCNKKSIEKYGKNHWSCGNDETENHIVRRTRGLTCRNVDLVKRMEKNRTRVFECFDFRDLSKRFWSFRESEFQITLFQLKLNKRLKIEEIIWSFTFQLQYYKGIPAEFEVLVLPGCAEFCPIARFIELTKEIVPESPMEACYGPYWNSRLVPSNENPIEWMYKKLETIFDM